MTAGRRGRQLTPRQLDTGSAGTMPHPAIIDAYRRVCDRHAAGNAIGASDLCGRLIAPLLRAKVVGGLGKGDGGGTLVWVHTTRHSSSARASSHVLPRRQHPRRRVSDGTHSRAGRRAAVAATAR
ncbi:MAG: hypothetical protein ACR2NO_11530 [Chloroflexota bacterium]